VAGIPWVASAFRNMPCTVFVSANPPLNHLHPTTTELPFLTMWEEEEFSSTSCPKHGVTATFFITSSWDYLVAKTFFIASFN
jgi:hypothetical protein